MISNIDILSSNLAVLESQVFDTVPIFFDVNISRTIQPSAKSGVSPNIPWSKNLGKYFIYPIV